MTLGDLAPDRQHVHDRIDPGLLYIVNNFLTVLEERFYARIGGHHLWRFASAKKSGIAIVAGNDCAVEIAFTEHFGKHELFFAEGGRRLDALHSYR